MDSSWPVLLKHRRSTSVFWNVIQGSICGRGASGALDSFLSVLETSWVKKCSYWPLFALSAVRSSQQSNTRFSRRGATTWPPRLLTFGQLSSIPSNHSRGPRQRVYLCIGQRKKLTYQHWEPRPCYNRNHKNGYLKWSTLSSYKARPLATTRRCSMRGNVNSGWQNFSKFFKNYGNIFSYSKISPRTLEY